jgi:hypothetical protein
MWTFLLALLLGISPPANKDWPAGRSVKAVRVDAVVISKGSSAQLDLKTGRPIKHVWVTDPKVVRVVPVILGGGLYVTLEGLKPGVARLTLTDIDGTDDKVIVIVEEPSK